MDIGTVDCGSDGMADMSGGRGSRPLVLFFMASRHAGGGWRGRHGDEARRVLT